MTTTPDGQEHLLPADGIMPTSEKAFANRDDDAGDKVPNINPPAYEDVVRPPRSQPSVPRGPPKLEILAATWGGVVVTPEIQLMVTTTTTTTRDRSGYGRGGFDTLSLNMHTIHTELIPDPNVGVVKSLSVLYRYSDSDRDDIRLLNVPQFAPQISFTVTPTDHGKPKINVCGSPEHVFLGLGGGGSRDSSAWRDAQGKVEILAAVYGLERVRTPSALEELARFFRGERGQVRTTSEFFRASAVQAFVGPKKTWTVYFRLLSEGEGDDDAAGGGRVRCVTGWEDGALEVPWTL